MNCRTLSLFLAYEIKATTTTTTTTATRRNSPVSLLFCGVSFHCIPPAEELCFRPVEYVLPNLVHMTNGGTRAEQCSYSLCP